MMAMRSVRSCALVFLATGCGDAGSEPGHEQQSATAAAPAAAVNPSSNLQDGQTVTVSASGLGVFGQFIEGVIVQCRAGVPISTGIPDLPAECGDALRYTSFDGTVARDLVVRYTVEPFIGEPFNCDTPGACVVVVKPWFDSIAPLIVPISFSPLPPVQRGSINAGIADASTGDRLQVRGTGWAAGALVKLGICRPGGTECQQQTQVRTETDGTFAIEVPAERILPTQLGFIDCTAAAGACVISAADLRDPDTSRSEAAVQFAPLESQRGTATLDASAWLIDGAPVRLDGTGWLTGRIMRVLQCRGATFEFCVDVGQGSPDGEGALQAHPVLVGRLHERPELDCEASPNLCSLVLAD
ncbi:MAG TPA: hypothetical protein VK524_02130, partial [Polyangiaceae bacterium]|nr:hypothetical protein [Polyangiaceae bacterium]